MWYAIAAFLILWTIAGVWWALHNLGHKYRKGKWYDYLLSPPVFALIYLLLAVQWLLKPKCDLRK